MLVSRGKFRFRILTAGLLGIGLAIAGMAASSYAASNPGTDQNGNAVASAHKTDTTISVNPLKEFEFRGTGSLVSSVFGEACESQVCTASMGTCGCLTYSGTGNGTKVGYGATWTYNQTTNDDDIIMTGLLGDRCFPTEGDGTITSSDGNNSVVFHSSGWACEFGGLTFFNTNNTIYLSPGTGKLASAYGTANLAMSTEFASSNAFLNIDGMVQCSKLEAARHGLRKK
jgi:hypothetical protein